MNDQAEVKTEKVEYDKIMCKYLFSQKELNEIAETLAQKTQESAEVEAEKKSVASSYKERLEAIQLAINKNARLYKDRSEIRMIECEVERDFTSGVVRYIRTDNGEIAKEKKMTMAERQMSIDQAIEKADEQPTDEEVQHDLEIKKASTLMSQESSAVG